MKGKLGILMLAGIALASVGCVDRGKQAQAKQTQELASNPVRPVTVANVETKTVNQSLNVTGEVTTNQDSQIGAKRAGRITSVLVNDGDAVKSGQLLATMDNSDIQNQIQQAYAALSGAQALLAQAKLNAAIGPTKTAAAVASAQANLNSAKAALKKAQQGARPEEKVQIEWQVKAAKTNLDTAEKDLERKKELVAQGALAKSQLDLAQNNYMSALTQYNAALQSQLLTKSRPEDLLVAQEAVRSAEEGLRQAKAGKALDPLLQDSVITAQAQVQTAQAQVNIAKQALSDTQIRAPYDGRVAGKPIDTGTIVNPGQMIVRIVGSTGVYFGGNIPESQVSDVHTGKPVSVTIDALPGRTFIGEVAAVSPLAQSLGRSFQTRIVLEGDLTGVKPGMFASGDILVKSIPNALVIPSNAVLQREGKSVVFIVDGAKVHQVEVQTGLTQGNDIQVMGLAAGQQVVVRGQEDLVDGTPVTISPQTVAATRTESGG